MKIVDILTEEFAPHYDLVQKIHQAVAQAAESAGVYGEIETDHSMKKVVDYIMSDNIPAAAEEATYHVGDVNGGERGVDEFYEYVKDLFNDIYFEYSNEKRGVQ